jgi:hypothetical protein
MHRSLIVFTLAPLLACAPPPPLADADSPSAPLRAAIQRSEAKLFASEYANSSPAARQATEAYLGGLISAAWDLAEAETLLAEPTFATDVGVAGMPGLFNPDNLYSNALLEPGGSYRISGRRGTHLQLLLQVLDGYPLLVLGQSRLVIDTDDLDIEPGEDFEIFLGGGQRPGHWFSLAPDARALIVRRTFADWEHETSSELRIERLDAAPFSAPTSRFARAAEYLDRMTELWTGSFMLRLKLVPTNSLRAPNATRDGLVGQFSAMTHFELAPDEALLITAPRSAAKYQGVQVGDPWLVTPDFVRHQVSLNHTQAHADSDGKIRYVLAASDPGVPNWLDTAGNRAGYVFLRWQGLASPLGDADSPSAELVKLGQLRAKLPPDTPSVDAAARAQQLAARRHAPARKP